MEKESFEDKEVAGILNAGFISIKVDREERPDIDHFYMQACTALTGSGGWPLSVFLTPERKPFFAGTYFPKYDGQGTGFITLLKRLSYAWKNSKQALIESGAEITRYLEGNPEKGQEAQEKIDVSKAYGFFENSFDSKYGGFFPAPKFPSVPGLLFLLRYGKLNKESKALEMTEKTLDCMAEGGIFDHTGGGFFRYSTDCKWLVPHFEKMLYDNALMLMVYAEAAEIINRKYAAVAEKIYGYVSREMKSPGGGYFTSQDADSEGVEGKFYLFTPGEITEALGKTEGVKFCLDYGVTESGNFKGKNILNRIGRGFIKDDKRLNDVYRYRAKRIPPQTDQKNLTSSNALLAAALGKAGRLLKNQKMLEDAIGITDFIWDNLYKEGRLMSRLYGGEAAHKAVLDDYAYYLWALYEIYAADFGAERLKRMKTVAEQIISLFYSPEGGFYFSGNDVRDLPARQKNNFDGPAPSGNAIAAACFLRLSHISGEEEYYSYAESIINGSIKDIGTYPYGSSAMLCAVMLKYNAVSVKLADGKGTAEMLEALKGFNPFITVSAHGGKYGNEIKGLKGGAAYVCGNKGCLPPAETREELEKILNNI